MKKRPEAKPTEHTSPATIKQTATHTPPPELLEALKMAVEELENIYAHAKTHGTFAVTLGMWRRLTPLKAAIREAEEKE